MSTVIIAIIVLVVLVVLVMIFTGYFGRIFTPTVNNCLSQGGKCSSSCDTADVGAEIANVKGCPAASPKCCAKIGSIGIAEVSSPGGSPGGSPAGLPIPPSPPGV